jgi:phosphoribosyl 1,2-cyclic phosphodiesterase
MRYSGGMWLKIANVNILIDPGPGSLVRHFEFGLEPTDINIIVVSHRHLDHVADLNTMVEAASQSTKKPIDRLIAPRDVLEGDDPVLLKYLRKGIRIIEVLSEDRTFLYKDLVIRGTVRHEHEFAEVYGIEFIAPNKKVVYIPCGKFNENMLHGYSKNADLEIFNTTFYKHVGNYKHLSAEDVKKMLKVHKPKKAVITHFSPYILYENPERVAKELTKETGIPVIAAKDGMRLTF